MLNNTTQRTSSTVAIGKVTTLYHKVLNDTMKSAAFVSFAFRFFRQLSKVRNCLWDCFAEETNDYPAEFLAILFYVKEYLQKQFLLCIANEFLHLFRYFWSFWLIVAFLFQRRCRSCHTSTQERVDAHFGVMCARESKVLKHLCRGFYDNSANDASK